MTRQTQTETFETMTLAEAREIVAVAQALSDAQAALTAAARAFYPIAGLAAQLVEKG